MLKAVVSDRLTRNAQQLRINFNKIAHIYIVHFGASFVCKLIIYAATDIYIYIHNNGRVYHLDGKVLLL